MASENGMQTEGKLMDMLTGYAASHQHPFNVFIHLIGIPTILLGVLIPLTWIGFAVNEFHIYLAHIVIFGFFLFYLSLDFIFAVAFAIGAFLLAMLAAKLGDYPGYTAWLISAACFFGGYAAQFVGHAVEKSMPVLIKHPIQANLAAPFFTVVELFKIVGLRKELFDAVQQRVRHNRRASF